MNKKIKFQMSIVLAIFFVSSILPSVYAADEIEITYMHEGPPYWYGKGVLSSEIDGNEFVMDTNGVQIVSFSSGFVPISRDGEQIKFVKVGESDLFELTFLAKKPTGHGIYRLPLSLPEVHRDKNIKIEIEIAEKILYSDVDFEKHDDDGDFLVLEAETDKNNLNIIYATKLGYPIFANMLAATIFMFVLFGYLFLKRKEIKFLSSLRSKLREPESPIQLEGEEEHYKLSLDLNFLNPKKIFEYQKGRLSVKIPFSLLFTIFIVILFVVFIFSLLTPVSKAWDLLGSLKILVVIYGTALAILVTIFIASAKNEEGMLRRVSIVGGGIVWMIFGYLGFLGIVLGIAVGLLIYFLVKLLLRENFQ